MAPTESFRKEVENLISQLQQQNVEHAMMEEPSAPSETLPANAAEQAAAPPQASALGQPQSALEPPAARPPLVPAPRPRPPPPREIPKRRKPQLQHI